MGHDRPLHGGTRLTHDLAVVLVVGLALLCRGSSSAGAEVVLHEPVPVPQLRCEQGICRRDDAPATALPDAVISDDGLLRPPTAPPTPRDNEPIYNPLSAPGIDAAGPPSAGANPPPSRRTRVGPDRSTLPEGPGEHLYHEVFNPAVFPFKRMTALDAVNADETLGLRAPEPVPLASSGARLIDGRDPFFGSLIVDFSANQPVPLPSPAAEFRLLSYQVDPPAELRFFRDGADNLYVKSSRSGMHRLTYLVDGAQRYFAGPLLRPEAARPRLSDVPQGALFRLPPRVRHHAQQVLAHIGLAGRKDDDYLLTLERLVAYFRAFQQGELVGKSGSTYLDLALSQRGACRHRAYAFVITALGAGIPARYIENELHVFVEVLVPQGQGFWRRVNLGGAPLEQRLFGTENKVAYRDKGGDPFPQPSAYSNSLPRHVEGMPRQLPQHGGERGGDRAGERGGDWAGERGGDRTGEGEAARGERGPGGTSGAPGGGPVGAGPSSGPTEGGPPGARGPGAPGEAAEPRLAVEPGAGRQAGAVRGERSQDDPSADGARRDGGARDPRPATSSPPPRPAGADQPDRVTAAAAPTTAVPPPTEDTGAVGQPDARPDPPSRPLLATSVTLGVTGQAPGRAGRNLYRGATVRVRGQVQAHGTAAHLDNNGQAAGLEVALYLDAPTRPIPLGRTTTAADGSFSAEVEIPAAAPFGDHRLLARVLGDQTRRGSSSARPRGER